MSILAVVIARGRLRRAWAYLWPKTPGTGQGRPSAFSATAAAVSVTAGAVRVDLVRRSFARGAGRQLRRDWQCDPHDQPRRHRWFLQWSRRAPVRPPGRRRPPPRPWRRPMDV